MVRYTMGAVVLTLNDNCYYLTFLSPSTHRVPEVCPKYTPEYTPKYTPEYTPELKTQPHDHGNDIMFMLFDVILCYVHVIWYSFDVMLRFF